MPDLPWEALQYHFLEHALFTSHVPHPTDPDEGGRIYTVTKPMTAYKKVRVGAQWDVGIATLIIRPGALVYVDKWAFTEAGYCGERRIRLGDATKMRCSKAFVHSIALSYIKRRYDTQPIPSVGDQVNCAYSKHDHKFKYRVGRNVSPTEPFHMGYGACNPGIHFFLERKAALEY